jgi:hypothetical protein
MKYNGGSVKPDNAVEILQMADVDGALVGGASLSADSFTRIVGPQSQTHSPWNGLDERCIRLRWGSWCIGSGFMLLSISFTRWLLVDDDEQ